MPLINTADAVYVGGSAADKVYQGANLVWQATAPEPVTATLTDDAYTDDNQPTTALGSTDPNRVSLDAVPLKTVLLRFDLSRTLGVGETLDTATLTIRTGDGGSDAGDGPAIAYTAESFTGSTVTHNTLPTIGATNLGQSATLSAISTQYPFTVDLSDFGPGTSTVWLALRSTGGNNCNLDSLEGNASGAATLTNITLL